MFQFVDLCVCVTVSPPSFLIAVKIKLAIVRRPQRGPQIESPQSFDSKFYFLRIGERRGTNRGQVTPSADWGGLANSGERPL